MYEVIIPKSVIKEINKLPKPVVRKIQNTLGDIAENPYMGMQLKGDLSAVRKWGLKEKRSAIPDSL